MKEIKEAAKNFFRNHPADEVGVSRLQRELKIGYTQAANILIQLEDEGFISSNDDFFNRKFKRAENDNKTN